jgi:hypothetical protein
LEEILVRNDKFKKRWMAPNQIKNKIKFLLSLPRILNWEKDKVQYCVICRVEFNNLKEKDVILPIYNSLISEICINNFKNNKMCPICNDYHVFKV